MELINLTAELNVTEKNGIDEKNQYANILLLN